MTRQGAIGKCYIPVNACLPCSIVESVEEVQEHRSNIFSAIGPVKLLDHGRTGVRLLEGIAAAPDDEGEAEKDNPGDLGSRGAANLAHIEQHTPDGGSNDLGEPVEQAIQSTGADAEVEAIDGILLVDVEPVGNEEHGEEQDDEGLESQRFPETLELRHESGVLHDDDAGAVLADDVLGIAQEESQSGAEEHQDDKADVGAISDRRSIVVEVGAEGDQTTEHGAHVEDGPEPSKVAALLVLIGVGDHDGALGSPQKTSADTEEDTGEQREAIVSAVQRAEQAAGIDGVTDATKGKAGLDTEPVDKSTTEETEDSKSAVQSRVL